MTSEMELVGVRVDMPSNTPVMLLRELEGDRRLLAIMIGGPEAQAIAFALDGVELVVDDEALDAVVDAALALKTGARGLRSVLEGAMLDLMFDAPDTHAGTVCRITEATITEGAAPIYEERKASA